VTIAFGMPGRQWDQETVLSWTALCVYMIKHDISWELFTPTSADLYVNRCSCVCPQEQRFGRYPASFKDFKPYNGKIKPDRIFFIDTDMVFTPEQVMMLVEHDVDMVSGVGMKGPNVAALGYQGSVGEWKEGDTARYFSDLVTFLYDEEGRRLDTFAKWADSKKNEKGLVEVDYCGSAFLCIKPSVYEVLEYPYYKTITFKWQGDMMASEDVGFCMRVKEAGFKIYADPNCNIGHKKPVVMVAHKYVPREIKVVTSDE
jgi:hypothetical protein